MVTSGRTDQVSIFLLPVVDGVFPRTIPSPKHSSRGPRVAIRAEEGRSRYFANDSHNSGMNHLGRARTVVIISSQCC